VRVAGQVETIMPLRVSISSILAGLSSLLLLVFAASATANSGGISGRSGNPSTGGLTCQDSGCHGSSNPFGGSGSIGGSTTVGAGTNNNNFTIQLSGSGGNEAGFNLSATGGTLDASGAGTQELSGELTHTSPQSISGNAASWSFQWDAPSGDGSYTFYFCINQVDGDNAGTNDTDDGPVCTSQTITVDDANPTTSGIPNVNVLEDAGNVLRNLNSYFADAEDGDPVSYTVTNNTNPSLFTSTNIASDTLTLDFAPDQNGFASIQVRATDSQGQTVFDTFSVSVTAVNDEPSFTKGPNQNVNENSGSVSVPGWASNIDEGAANESGQTLTFNVSNDNTGLFSSQPAVSSAGTLTFAVDPNNEAGGSATVTISLSDSGGTANGGDNLSASDTFTINVSSQNDDPFITSGTPSPNAAEDQLYSHTFAVSDADNGSFSFGLSGEPTGMTVDSSGNLTWTPSNAQGGITYNVTVTVDDLSGGTDTQSWSVTSTADNDSPTVANPVSDFSVDEDAANTVIDLADGAANVFDDIDNDDASLAYAVDSNSNPALVGASINGSNELVLSYTADGNGSASITVSADDGEFTVTDDFVVTVTALNDAPTINLGTDQTVDEDAGAQSVNGWAGGFDPGPPDESGQSISDYLVSNDNNGLFASQPDVDNSGNLTYTPAADANGSAIVTVNIVDDGGTPNGGDDTSPDQTFTITVNPVNDAPFFTKGADESVGEDAGAQSVPGWATGISEGAANEGAQVVTFNVSNDNNGLFSAQPAISSGGDLTYTPAANASGSATVTVNLSDDGGTPNGGDDTSADQTFTITVNGVNDPPSIASTPGTNGAGGCDYNYVVSVNDVDDAIDGSSLDFTILTGPTGMSVSDATGTVTWPGANIAAVPDGSTHNVTLEVADGGENGASPDTQSWTITVDQSDADGDGIGDVCDGDNGNDGIFDSALDFTVTQNGQDGIFLAQGAGTVTVNAALSPDLAGVDPIWDWSRTSSAVRGLPSYDDSSSIPATNSTGGEGVITFDPASLPAGQYTLRLTATTGSLSTRNSIVVDVRTGASAPADADNDGIPDTGSGGSDAVVGSSVINGTADGTVSEMVETAGSLSLRVGADAIAAAAMRGTPDSIGALISGDEARALVGDFGQFGERTNTGGWFDFEVRGLTPGGSARVVLPLQSRLRPDAVYMKYHPGVGWQEFSVGGGDAIASAGRAGGLCPGPADAVWTSGLAAFDGCIRLTLTDGGPNDTDGEINGVIMDPGGAVAAGDDTSVDDPVGGGGGRLGPWSLLALLVGLLTLWRFGRHRKDGTA